MRPEQKIIMSCRQTGEKAERLLEWLDQSHLMLKAQSRALRIEVQGIANELLTIVEAVEQPPTAGLVGAWGSARTELIGALMTETQTAAPDDEAHLVLTREKLMTLLPRDSEGGASASLRLTAADRAEAPFRFPIRLSLLGQLDLVKIIATAYLVHVPPRRQKLASASAVAQRLNSNALEITQQAFSGISRRDVDTLRDTLHAIAPETASLRQLDAAGYWDTLGGLVPHLPETLRRKAFALLWGEDPALTQLFETLSDAIELLGFSGEAFAGLDALLGRDPSTGWMVRHDDSLIGANTIADCFNRPEKTIRVSSRHGRASDVQRFVLAALVDECRLPVAPANLPLLETADFLVLPAARPVMLWPSPHGGQMSSSPAITGLSAIEAIEIFAAQKAGYLVDRAIRRQTLTSLLVAADLVDRVNGIEIDAGATMQIANWVEITQGETPHARERRRTGLSILAADVHGNGTVSEPVLNSADGGDPRLAATIEAVLDGNADWAQEWTPNRSFRNVFTWRPPRSALLPSAIVGQPGSADILRFERLKSADSSVAMPVSELAPGYDLANLQHAMTQATSGTVHLQQLSARLTDLRRSLSARFLRLHISNDPSAVVEWRRQICHVARSRLQRSAQTGNFGRLQRALMFGENEALAVLARLKVEERRPSLVAPDLRTLEPTRIVEACLEAWVAAMRQISRAPALMRAVQVPGAVVAHMVDELVLGALRIGLQEKLSEAVRRIQLSAVRAVDCEQSVAALMERGINAYVEALDPSARTLRNSVHRDTRFGMGNAATGYGSSLTARQRTDAGRGDTSRGDGRRETARGDGGRQAIAAGRRLAQVAPSAVADEWADTFADLIEANILGAGLLGGAGHLNRELGEVLSAMSASPFEGVQ